MPKYRFGKHPPKCPPSSRKPARAFSESHYRRNLVTDSSSVCVSCQDALMQPRRPPAKDFDHSLRQRPVTLSRMNRLFVADSGAVSRRTTVSDGPLSVTRDV